LGGTEGKRSAPIIAGDGRGAWRFGSWVLRRVFLRDCWDYGTEPIRPASLPEHIREQRVGGQVAFREVPAENVGDDVEKIKR
jgi:hypothetical protein